MATQIADPKTPESKPHGTTQDQVNEMENEGQAQPQGQPVPPPGPDEAARPGADRDIDTAGLEADPQRSATHNPTGHSKHRNVEGPDAYEAYSRGGTHRSTAHH